MAHAADSMQPEFWRPPMSSPRPQPATAATRTQSEVCQTCGTEFVLGARYCHVCGAGRDEVEPVTHERAWMKALDLSKIGKLGEKLHLPTASLVAMFFGVVCIIAAFVTGLLYTDKTLTDWQAIQIWRIEWLLAAAVAFILGILLRPTEAR